ncbi:hypothetical protein [Virgibacillus dokdonensis]|uniref:Lipoprotein n=1 Tax=Virgibacillus dokdonensis TaxID=302167 RepID=A0A2K9IZV5_9BACI|nr:hypothetical protein [Virgibacillus dokdonensis]AUJ24313.1 hypothetical protein A21D_01214 [Virgibacillus dokdonensis]
MKNQTKKIYGSIVLTLLIIFLLAGCANSAEEGTTTVSETNNREVHKNNDLEKTPSSNTPSKGKTGESKDASSEDNAEKDTLSNYSTEEIEYARIWLQLGSIKDVEELNIRHISAETPLNPDDETSASYPEDVIQLSGSRLVAGSVTYSSNGDGTINVYNIPLRWDGNYPVGEDFYKDLIKNTELVRVDKGEDNKISALINKMNTL